tara:strand:- start:86 stop:472 length:387 start_codon:yes stop_codon:yes gene_type:complete
MEEEFPGIKNYNVRVLENEDGVVFLHNIVPGATTRSYGIHVAKLAGLPKEIITRADHILDELESIDGSKLQNKDNINYSQLSFGFSESKLLENVKNLNLENMTPLEAITKLYELKQIADTNDEHHTKV